MPESVRAGVIGVGSMGRNHARVYHELPGVELVGVHDAAGDQAASVADEYETSAVDQSRLLDRIDVASIAVPTRHHYATAKRCLEADIDVLVEKPFVADLEKGRELVDLADRRGLVLGVGHVERYNPVTARLLSFADDLDIIAVTARRLGPPVDREIEDTVVMDLMIHDIDVLMALLDTDVEDVNAAGIPDGGYATATLEFADGVLGQLTASRVTQEKVRELTITAQDCRVRVNYIDQSLDIYRQSLPAYVREDGDVRYHHKNVVEQVSVQDGEPLKNELDAFVEAARTGEPPAVCGEDALAALAVTHHVDRLAGRDAVRRAADRPIPGTPTQG